MKNNAKSSRKEMIEETIEVEKDRYVNLDALKTVAIYLVCMYHYNSYQLDMIHHPSFYTYLSYFIHSLAACAVPLFFMVNGAIRMNRSVELRSNTIRVVRMILLILLWGVLGYSGFRFLNGEPFHIRECITSLWTWRTGEINHLWFLVTLSGIYLMLPLLKVLYDNEKQQYMKYFFALVTIATFGNVCISQFANILEYIVGVNYIPADEYNFMNEFNLFRGTKAYALVYFILGGYLFLLMEKKQTFPYLGKLKGLAIVMVILQLLYGIMMSKTNGEPYDLVWYSYSSIPVALACTVIFLRNYQINVNPLMMRLLRLIGSNTLGILLLHRFVGASLYPWYQGLSCSDRIIPNLIFAAVICVVSLGATLLLKKVPVLRRLFYI